MNHLLTPYQLNPSINMKNRIVMAPMTRAASSSDGVPTQQMAEYYQKRAKAGLIVTEGTLIRADARGHANVPGIFTDAQIAGWRKVTDAVHQQNGLIFLQLWHVGRVSHPHFLNGELPISSSATTMTGPIPRSQNLQFGDARELTTAEIQQLVVDYGVAARNALVAGFDGVEIHGANGYLLDQFLHFSTNLRDDEYGGTPEKNSRFVLELVRACGDAVGFDRVALRLSPGGYLNQISGHANDAITFSHLLSELNKLELAYIHTGNFNDKAVFPELNQLTMTEFLRKHYQGTLIACGGYTPNDAEKALENNAFDLIAFGRPFIANPDLVTKVEQQAELIAYSPEMLATLV